jgi:hypothetical protein
MSPGFGLEAEELGGRGEKSYMVVECMLSL